MTATMSADTGRQRTLTALFLAVAMAATVGSALGFQYLGGYIPCHLCLEQRTPYYIGVPLMVLAAIASMLHAPAWLTRGLLAVGGLLMLYGLYLGVYHSGVEWQWWAGPTDCTAGAGP
ncbi:MAG: disulfide bond formation protein B, partial [Mesorhizobium sp.]